MQKPADRPWVIAHRGASHALRENTLPAFREAFARGADAAEMDVRRTADGALVVHHDAEVPGAGAIIGLTRAEIGSAAPWIPNLEQALAACAGMWVNVEIKNSPADPDWDEQHQAAHLTAAILRKVGPVDRFLVSSFNPGTIGVFATISPDVRTGWLSDVGIEPLHATRLAAKAGHASIHPYVDAMAGEKAEAVVAAAREAGLLVIVWTVDDTAEMVRLADAGVDGIITNRPVSARSAFEDRNGDGS